MTIEGRILDLGIDKEPQILFNLRSLHFKLLVLLLDGCKDTIDYLIGHKLHMAASPACINRVDKAHLLELARIRQ